MGYVMHHDPYPNFPMQWSKLYVPIIIKTLEQLEALAMTLSYKKGMVIQGKEIFRNVKKTVLKL